MQIRKSRLLTESILNWKQRLQKVYCSTLKVVAMWNKINVFYECPRLITEREGLKGVMDVATPKITSTMMLSRSRKREGRKRDNERDKGE